MLSLCWLVAACAGPAPAPTAMPSPPPAALTISPPASSPSPASSATPSVATRPELIICLAHEPASLYRYALPEADGGLSRAHLLAALEDGPVDRVNFGAQPVLLEKLPALADGEARIEAVTARASDWVVDELGRVVTLTAGVTVNVLDGGALTYAGEGEVQLPQVTARFTLKPGLRWSDGAPLVAADSVFGFETAASPDSYNPQRGRVERTAAYRALDARTVEWTGRPGLLDPDLSSYFWPPLPRHRYAGRTPAEMAADEAAGRAPLSYGPFVIGAWSPGERVTLERNPFYFRAAEGLPRLERVIYRFTPDPAALAADLADGACDVAPRGALDDETAVQLAPEYVRWSESAIQETLVFGLAPAAGPGLFAEARARRAVAHCLDRAALLPPAPLGARQAASQPFPAGLETLAFDPARGRALLAELGWTDSDGDGLLDRGGAPLRVTLAAGPAGDARREALVTGLVTQLAANCGITVAAQRLTEGERLEDWPDGVLFGRRFDLALVGWNVAAADRCAALATAQIAADGNPAGANLAGYSRAAYDDACRRARTALDPAAAAAAQVLAESFLVDDIPLLPLAFRLRVAGARPEVSGLTLDATSVSELWPLETTVVLP